jgi:hypothetical protein
VAGIQVSNVVDHSKQDIHVVPSGKKYKRVTKIGEDKEDIGKNVINITKDVTSRIRS